MVILVPSDSIFEFYFALRFTKGGRIQYILFLELNIGRRIDSPSRLEVHQKQESIQNPHRYSLHNLSSHKYHETVKYIPISPPISHSITMCVQEHMPAIASLIFNYVCDNSSNNVNDVYIRSHIAL